MLNRLPAAAAPLASAPAVAYKPSVSVLSSCASVLTVIVAVERFTSTFTGSAVSPCTSPASGPMTKFFHSCLKPRTSARLLSSPCAIR